MTDSTISILKLISIPIIFIVGLLLMLKLYRNRLRSTSKKILELKDYKEKKYIFQIDQSIKTMCIDYRYPYEEIELTKEDIEEYKQYYEGEPNNIKNFAKIKLHIKNNTNKETRTLTLKYTNRKPYVSKNQYDNLGWKIHLWNYRDSFLLLNNKYYPELFDGSNYNVTINYTGTKGYDFNLYIK